jgi:hypothetical protein
MERILILVVVLFITGFPYVVFFLIVNIGRLPLPSYGHRIIFMFISFGQGIVMLLTLIYTNDVRESLFSILTKILLCIKRVRVQNVNTVNIRLQAHEITPV